MARKHEKFDMELRHVFPPAICDVFERAAARHGIPAAEMLLDFLALVAEADLVEYIMDEDL